MSLDISSNFKESWCLLGGQVVQEEYNLFKKLFQKVSAYCSETCKSETGQCWFAMGALGVCPAHICSKTETVADVIRATTKLRAGRLA